MPKSYIIQHPKKGIYLGEKNGNSLWSSKNYDIETVGATFPNEVAAVIYIQNTLHNDTEIEILEAPQMSGGLSILSLELTRGFMPYPTENKKPC